MNDCATNYYDIRLSNGTIVQINADTEEGARSAFVKYNPSSVIESITLHKEIPPIIDDSPIRREVALIEAATKILVEMVRLSGAGVKVEVEKGGMAEAAGKFLLKRFTEQ